MIFLLFLMSIGSLSITFDIDNQTEITIFPGSTIDLEITAEIHKARFWEVKDPEIVKLKVQRLASKGWSATMGRNPSKTIYQVTCSRDCKVGDVFELDFTYKFAKLNTVLEEKKIIVTVIERQEEL